MAVLLACLLVAAASPALAWRSVFGLEESRQQVVWAYQGEKGPEHWGDLSPEFAACNGERQSPIDLSGSRRLRYSPLSFRYRSSALSVHNDGRSVRVDVPPGSSLVAGGHEYELTGFHFHAPGEHQINGVSTDMELQLEHRDRQGRIAVVAVPIRAGRRMNSTLSRIWDHIPGGRGQRFYGRQTGINPRFLLPNDHSYFSYLGSLTEPPCSEGVEWFVFAKPLEVDRSYVQRFLSAVGPNARPIQPLNGRSVLSAFRR
jgi:carbonic anhydrase